jgi:hypothetical protein
MQKETLDKILFEGVVVGRFDLILGPTASAMHPAGFMTQEAARNVAEDTMLLLSTGKRDTIYSVMSFVGIQKLGVVGVHLSPVESAIGVITVFSENARGIIWEAYPLLRSLIAKNIQNARRQPTDVALRVFRETERICECSPEERDLSRLIEAVENDIEKTYFAFYSLRHASRLDKPDMITPDRRVRIDKLVAILRESRGVLKEKMQLLREESDSQTGPVNSDE